MEYCHACGEDRAVMIVMDQGANGMPTPVRKCDKGHRLVAAPPVVQQAIVRAIGTQVVSAKIDLYKSIDVVKLAKARLRDINREITRLQKLTAERDELVRLIDAAKPKAVVRHLKAAQ